MEISMLSLFVCACEVVAFMNMVCRGARKTFKIDMNPNWCACDVYMDDFKVMNRKANILRSSGISAINLDGKWNE